MSRPRIVIRAFTRRRDVASAALLAKLLEHQGCDVLITGVRDFTRTLRQWKPEVAIVNTPGKAAEVRKISPETKTVFLEGEGFLPDDAARSVAFSRDIAMYHAIDLFLMWGDMVRDQIKEALPNEDLSKIHVVGNPTYDLIRYMPDEVKTKRNSNSIGAIMRYHNINDRDGIQPVRRLPNPGNLERIIVQCQSFVGIIECMRALLENTDYEISIRPHPLEQVESYQQFKSEWFGEEHARRVTIDDTISFSDWVVKQHAVLSPTSTSLLEAYLLKVPVINVDALANTDNYNKNYADVSREWQAAGLAPQSLDQLVELVKSGLPPVKRDEAIEQQLIKYCDFDKERSACLQASRYIVKLARKTSKPKGVRMPTWLVDRIDDLSFKRACRNNPLHPNLHFRRGYHEMPENLEAVMYNILHDSKETV